jgi:hypothetical protein
VAEEFTSLLLSTVPRSCKRTPFPHILFPSLCRLARWMQEDSRTVERTPPWRSGRYVVCHVSEQHVRLASLATYVPLSKRARNDCLVWSCDIGTPDYFASNVPSFYFTPELLEHGATPACCSDHQPSRAGGVPATPLFEHVGPVVRSVYHNTGGDSEPENFGSG